MASSDLPAAPPAPTAALQDAFDRETRQGVILAALGRGAYFLIVVVSYLANALSRPGTLPFYRQLDVIFIIQFLMIPLAVVNYLLAARSRRPMVWSYVFMILDMIVIAELTWGWLWTPPVLRHTPLVIAVRYQDATEFVAFLAIYTLPLSSRLALWAGAVALMTWNAGLIEQILIHKEVSLYWGPFGPGAGAAALERLMQPNVLVVDYAVIVSLLIAVFVGFVALACWEGRRYLIARVAAEADLAFLRRLFPGAVAERIVRTGEARIAPTRRRVAVMFASLRLDETPDASELDQLQAYYLEVDDIARAHGGMLDRFTGGPAMAVFGALDDDPHAAEKALACAAALASQLGAARGRQSIALNAGQAVCGEAGGGRSRAFSVVGDVVNTARRVLDETGDGITLATDALRDALPRAAARDGLQDLGETALRGRAAPVRLWRISA